ncbi:MAG TPA: hypothetical protein VGK87_12850, partial [Anaerolineae bacterium]
MEHQEFRIMAFPHRLNRIPWYKNIPLAYLMKQIRFGIWKRYIASRVMLSGRHPVANQQLWISPDAVSKVGIGLDNKGQSDAIGNVVAGDWDMQRMTFDDLDLMVSFRAHFVNSEPWSNTSYFRYMQNALAGGIRISGITSQAEIEAHLQAIDRHYADISQNGYQPQTLYQTSVSTSNLDDVSVNITRNGELVVERGRQRLAIAKLLNLPRIPVKVGWRHTQWSHFRAQILDYA